MKILFLGNDASRTGAPLVLLYLIEWLRRNTEAGCEVLLRVGGGPLQEEFARLAPTERFESMVTDRGLLRRAVRRLGFSRMGGVSVLSGVETLYAARGIDLIFANTVTHGGLLADLARLEVPVISYIHELDSMIRQYGATNLAHVKAHTTHFIAGSRTVAQNLVEAHGIPAERMDTVPGFISAAALEGGGRAREDVRARWGIPAEAFLVLGSGFRNWRKGKDLFVQVASAVRHARAKRPVHFLWVGGRAGDDEYFQIQHDVMHAGLSDTVHLVAEVANHADYSAACDVLATVSREDPFPLTNLEAGYFGKPVLCFDGAGGSPEFVEANAGFVLPYLDVAAMAGKILLLAEQEPLRKVLGECAARKVRERHEVNVAGAQLWAIMQKVRAKARTHQ